MTIQYRPPTLWEQARDEFWSRAHARAEAIGRARTKATKGQRVSELTAMLIRALGRG